MVCPLYACWATLVQQCNKTPLVAGPCWPFISRRTWKANSVAQEGPPNRFEILLQRSPFVQGPSASPILTLASPSSKGRYQRHAPAPRVDRSAATFCQPHCFVRRLVGTHDTSCVALYQMATRSIGIVEGTAKCSVGRTRYVDAIETRIW